MAQFIDCLLEAPTPVIMEIKRRSASGADLMRGRSVAELVEQYHGVGAPCLSVVTGAWFGGDNALLEEVASLAHVPVLRKDFITKDSEVAESKAMGASAVLLVAKVLSGFSLRRLTEAALRHELTPFVEVTAEAHLLRVFEPQRCVIAVNNKDIRDRELGAADFSRSSLLLPALRRADAGAAVSASGIERAHDARRLLDSGFDGLLIGTGLLAADDLEGWIADATIERPAPASR
jgi:indole-3-glycerol phosphate synthase